jgi:putative colanic acid biosynthesis UDP-glucose lipid carrier transferase
MNEPVILKNSLGIAVLALLQVLLPALAAVACLYVVNGAFTVPYTGNINLLALLALMLMLLLPRQRRTSDTPIFARSVPMALGALARWGVVLAVLLAIGFVTKETQDYPRRVLLAWAAVTGPVLVVVTLLLDRIMYRALSDPANARRAVFAGINEVSLAMARQLRVSGEYCMEVDGFFDDRSAERLNAGGPDVKLLGRLQDLAAYVNANGVRVIFVSLPMRHLQRVRDLLDDMRDTTASIYYLPDVFVFDLIQSRIGEISGMPVVALCETPFYGLRGVVKRLTDIAISSVALLLLLPFLLLIAALIKINSTGPAIFRQRRYGLDGHEIVVYKFRTMKVTEDQGPIVQARREDERVTSIGRFLRRYSIDELPQLFNVLQGRMSLVGPRPHAVAHNEEYRKLIKGYMVRHKVQPGITGLAQVNGCRGETSRLEEMEARVKYDLDYLRNWSPMLDIKILFATVVIVFSDKRAY